MFCNNCGTELPEGAVFCQKCGASRGNASTGLAQNSQQKVANADPVQDRESLIALMESSTSAMDEVKKREDTIKQYEEKVEKLNEMPVKRIGIGCGIIGVILAIQLTSKVITDFGVQCMMSFFIIVACIIMVSVICSKIKNNHLSKIADERAALEKAKSNIALDWLPYDYRESVAFAYIYSYLQNQRAHNLTEAINLFETEKHQARLELISSISAALYDT